MSSDTLELVLTNFGIRRGNEAMNQNRKKKRLRQPSINRTKARPLVLSHCDQTFVAPPNEAALQEHNGVLYHAHVGEIKYKNASFRDVHGKRVIIPLLATFLVVSSWFISWRCARVCLLCSGRCRLIPV